MNASCILCGNVSSYDKDSLKGSTWNINGLKQVLCIPCEDELLQKIAKGRGLKIKYGDGGEISKLKIEKGIVIDHPNKDKIYNLCNEFMFSDERDRVMELVEGCG